MSAVSPNKIDIQDLDLFIGKKHILKKVNVGIPENKITVILGPSGCGKTTLLKCLNRLIDLNIQVKVSGQIWINEEEILHTRKDITLIRKKMGLLSQRPFPLPMNIYNNVAFGLRISGRKNKKFLDKRVEYYLKQAHLWDEVKDRLRDPASALSIGQQQRLCLARGLAVDPEIILADEPTSALDPISSMAIEQMFLELKQNFTVVVVTHMIPQAMRIADHVVFMYLGEVIEQGSVEKVFQNPDSEITKKFLQGDFN